MVWVGYFCDIKRVKHKNAELLDFTYCGRSYYTYYPRNVGKYNVAMVKVLKILLVFTQIKHELLKVRG